MTAAIVIRSLPHSVCSPEEDGLAIGATVFRLDSWRIEELVTLGYRLEAVRHLLCSPYRNARTPWSPRSGGGPCIDIADDCEDNSLDERLWFHTLLTRAEIDVALVVSVVENSALTEPCHDGDG